MDLIVTLSVCDIHHNDTRQNGIHSDGLFMTLSTYDIQPIDTDQNDNKHNIPDGNAQHMIITIMDSVVTLRKTNI
jgi:hypothetical protein